MAKTDPPASENTDPVNTVIITSGTDDKDDKKSDDD